MKRPSPATGRTREFPPPQPPKQRSKKTRELPNLSDCHCCNRRINSTNPRNRLGILTSEWRIVLLCKSCHNLVESAQFCSYCLTRVSSEFYECKKCRRRIHKNCAAKYSFSSSGNCFEELSVCFDCWMPNLLENEYSRIRAVRNGSSSKKQLGKNGVKPASLASSGVCNLQEKGKVLENVVNEANVIAEKKIDVAVEAKEKAFTRVMVAKKAVDLASGALGIVAVDKGGDQGGSVVDVDAQLAIRLHREMNSSPRISRNLCLLNTHCVDVPKVNGVESRGANETSCSGRETNVGVNANDTDMGSIAGRERNGSGGARQECGNNFGRARDGKRNGDSKGCLVTYIRKGQASKVVKRKKEQSSPLKVYCRKPSEVVKLEHDRCLSQVVKLEAGQCPSQVVKLEAGQCSSQFEKLEAGQCSQTYTRKRVRCKRKLVNSSLNVENGNLAPTSLTCREEPMAITNAS